MNRSSTAVLGAVLVAIAISLQHLYMGPAVIALSVGLIIAYAVWLNTLNHAIGGNTRVTVIYGVAVLVQALHLLEEYLTGFQRQLPSIWDSEWTDHQFLTFNLVWLTIFAMAGFGVAFGVRLAFLVAWFMAIVGGVGNGLFHITLSVFTGGYFPGLATGTVHLVVGVLLIAALVHAGDGFPTT
jgi:hypothetical protein